MEGANFLYNQSLYILIVILQDKRIKKARWWNRLGGKPVGHAASPRFKSRETRHYCKTTNPCLTRKNNPI